LDIIVSFLTVSKETFIIYEIIMLIKKNYFSCLLLTYKITGEIMDGKDSEGILENSPFIAWIHNLSKNQFKYLNNRISEFNLGHEVRYIMMIYDNPNISQDDLVLLSGQSKGNIAKSLRKLEDGGYIEREVNPENRRKYMLKTTSKGNELVPKVRKISKDWEKEVGITEEDNELKIRLREIAINGMRLVEDM